MAIYKVTVDEAVTTLGVTEAVTILSEQVTGIQGATGQGLATGGTTNQVLAKNSNTNFDTKWIDAGGGGGSGTVTSVATGIGLTGGPITTSGTLSLADVSPAPTGTYGSATAVPAITVDIKGRTTAVTSTPIQLNSASAVTGLNTTLANKANTNTTNSFSSAQTVNAPLTVNGGNLYVQGPSAPVYFNYDSMTGDIDLTTGSLNTTGNVGGGTGFFSIVQASNQIRLVTDLGLSQYARFQGTFTGLRTITVPDANITIAGAGANSDITSITGLTTPLTTAQGGTGSATASGTGSNVLAINPVITKPTITRAVYQNAAPGTLTWTANASTIASSILTAGWMRITSANLTATGTLNLPSTTICAAFLTTNGEASDVIIINEASFAVTTTGVTGVTLTGNVTIAANSSATFRFYRTSLTAFVWVRIA